MCEKRSLQFQEANVFDGVALTQQTSGGFEYFFSQRENSQKPKEV